MALEDTIVELISALNRNTAMGENLTKLRAEAITDVKAASKPAAKKPAVKKQNISETPEDRKDPDHESTPQGPTHDDLADVIKAYMGLNDDKDMRTARGANVKKIFSHDKVNAVGGKHSGVPVDKIAMVIAGIKKLHAKDAAAIAAGGSDDDDLLS